MGIEPQWQHEREDELMNTWRLSLAGLIMAVLVMSGCGPTLGQSFRKVESVPVNKVLIYIYRPRVFLGWSTIDVTANDKDLITLSKCSYFPYLADPGVIHFKANLGGHSKYLTVYAKPNRPYFLKTGGRGQFLLTLMPPEEGEREMGECRLVLDEKP